MYGTLLNGVCASLKGDIKLWQSLFKLCNFVARSSCVIFSSMTEILDKILKFPPFVSWGYQMNEGIQMTLLQIFESQPPKSCILWCCIMWYDNLDWNYFIEIEQSAAIKGNFRYWHYVHFFTWGESESLYILDAIALAYCLQVFSYYISLMV